MTNQSSESLIPSEDEIKRIVAHIMQTDPTSLPVVLLQIEFARLMLKVLSKLSGELAASIEQLENGINGIDHKL